MTYLISSCFKANSSVDLGNMDFIGSMMDKLSFEQRFKAAYLGI
jgi:hypothetical protein